MGSSETPSTHTAGAPGNQERPASGEKACLAAENAALVQLHEISARLVGEEDLPTLLQAVMNAAVTVSGAQKGTLQLYDTASRSLRIAAQQGFQEGLLEQFGPICEDDQTTCAEVLRRRERVIVEDLAQKPAFLGRQALAMLASAGVGATQATPLMARDGSLLGVIATFWSPPHRPDETTLRVLDLLARHAADLIEHRRRVEGLAMELAATRKLQEISLQLIREDNVEALYEQIIAAAIEVMRSDMASLQMLHPERGKGGELLLLAYRGFDAASAEAFQWVGTDTLCICGAALATGRRVIAEDVESCDGSMVSQPVLDIYRRAGIRAVQSTPLRARNGRLLGMLSTHWHWPHRPEERELRLFDVLARQTADLLERSSTEAALRAADRRKDEFLATLAHELRNPLAPLRSSLEVLRLSGSKGPVVERVLPVMERQVNQLVRLVDDLLEVSRITRGKVELKKEAVDLAGIVCCAIEISQPLVAAARLHLAVSLPPAPLFLDADPMRLTQVFANLLNNAAKYTETDGEIRLTVRQEGETATVSVRDNGIGIPAEALPQVFDLFTQVARSTSRAQGGLGIGLNLARSLAQLHGGNITACSAGRGQGSEFVVRLPLTTRGPAMVTQARGPAAKLDAPQRILVVDDNRDAADSLGLLLKFLGAEIQVAYAGEAALAALEAFRPGVVLLDLGMPGMDGFEVARRIRLRPGLGDVHVIALTGWGQDEDRRRTAAAEFDHHLTKPVGVGTLQDLLASLQGRRKGV